MEKAEGDSLFSNKYGRIQIDGYVHPRRNHILDLRDHAFSDKIMLLRSAAVDV